MVSRFHVEALKLIRSHVMLLPDEFAILQVLLNAAESGSYWDTLSRLRAIHEGVDDVLTNIAGKAKFAGLAPELEKLRDDHGAEISDHVPERTEPVG